MKKTQYQNMKTIKLIISLVLLILLGSCQKFSNLNPNVPGQNSVIPPSMLLNRVENEMFLGPGQVDGSALQPGTVSEEPFSMTIQHNEQYFVSNDPYYGGSNSYGWSNTAQTYNMIKNVIQMENAAALITKSRTNAYAVMGKFYRAYCLIWLSERVGDIPMIGICQGVSNLTPAYSTQHDVYKACLALLDTANMMLNNQSALNLSLLPFTGDIFGFTGASGLTHWQKVINAYKLRVLISLSKKIGTTYDAGDLNITARLDSLINGTNYPLLGGESDNLIFTYNSAYNPYLANPGSTMGKYNNRQPMSTTLMNLLTVNMDPRTFIFSTPAKFQIDSLKKSVGDFTAYQGASIDSTYGALYNHSAIGGWGQYSYPNYARYYTSSATGPTTGDEAKGSILIGYPEQCFNIAEAINQLWVNGSASTWYMKGINASLSYFGVTQGGTMQVYDEGGLNYIVSGTKLTTAQSTITLNVDTFLTLVALSANQATAYSQILNQKYIAFWQNSGWTAFNNWRRTSTLNSSPKVSAGGYPSTFTSTDPLNILDAQGKIPRRWQYPLSEAQNNTANWQAACSAQFGGADDLFQDVWINLPGSATPK